MNDIHLITVGKLKNKNIEPLEEEYKKRLKEISLHIHEVKSHEENLDKEAEEIIKKIETLSKHGASIILLTEYGKLMDSKEFSTFLFKKIENSSRPTIFIIGGASGFGNSILSMKHETLSLSPMTFPHKLARLLFVEQIYRAETIKAKHPYHK
jgi:23S rRNA (pseudouridine1915-N3)-methyltransferase